MGRGARALAVAGVAAGLLAGVAAATGGPRLDGPADATATARRHPVDGAEPTTTTSPLAGGTSLRFRGTGRDGIDRVVIPLGVGTGANVGATDLTVELWVRGTRVENGASGCSSAAAGWTEGNVVVDRDTFGDGDRGDFGMSLLDGRVAWGAARGANGATVCGGVDVLDGAWHHVAVTRRASDGALRIFVDGVPDGASGPTAATGDISYRVGRSTSWPADPTLVLGAEKHDYAAEYPSFAGWVDEVRLSTVLRYTGPFTPPTSPFAPDAVTAALYHLDEGAGTAAGDAAGTSPGELRVGGDPVGPTWSTDVPWG